MAKLWCMELDTDPSSSSASVSLNLTICGRRTVDSTRAGPPTVWAWLKCLVEFLLGVSRYFLFQTKKEKKEFYRLHLLLFCYNIIKQKIEFFL